MTNSHRISIGPAGEHIALARWGEANSGKPPALLLHGTGFVAEVWDDVARELAQDYRVYALDRRGHGDSHKPEASHYHFQDFAEDVCRVVEAFDLSDIYGIGQRRRDRSVTGGETDAGALCTAVRDGADGDGSARGPT